MNNLNYTNMPPNDNLNQIYGLLQDSPNPYKKIRTFNELADDTTNHLINLFKKICVTNNFHLNKSANKNDLAITKAIFISEFTKCSDIKVRMLFYKKLKNNNLLDYAKNYDFYPELQSFIIKEQLANNLNSDLSVKSEQVKKTKI